MAIKNENKLVLFDWGGVIDTTDFEKHYSYRRIMIDAARYALNIGHGISDDVIWNMLMDGGYVDLSRSAKTNKEYRYGLRKVLEKMYLHSNTSSIITASERFIDYSLSHYKYVVHYEDILYYIYGLRVLCEVGLVSDVNWLEAHRLRSQVELSLLDYSFLSYEIGKTKGGGTLLDYVNECVEKKPENILFIDDYEPNVKAAQAIGWNAYKCGEHDTDGIKAVVSKFLKDI